MIEKTQPGDRGFVDWGPQKRSLPLVEDILSVVNYYQDGGYPAPTVRDVYYDLIGSRGYKKGDKFARKVYRFISKMRRVKSGPYGIDFSAITDDTPSSLVARTYDDPADFWSNVKSSGERYRKDLTMNQPRRVRVYTEGAGAVKQFHHVARDYTIPVWSPGGWDQLDLKHSTAMRAVKEYRNTGRETVLLHAGDFDPDGVALFEVFREDVHAFIEGYDEDPDILVFKRVMLTPEQAAAVSDAAKSPMNPEDLKEKNYRGRKWPLPYKVELQALNLERRLDIMREAIGAELDHAQLDRDRRASEDEHHEVNDTLKELARGEGGGRG
jgi:hypothetical protein